MKSHIYLVGSMIFYGDEFRTADEFMKTEGLSLEELFLLLYDAWAYLPAAICINGQLLLSTKEDPSVRERRNVLVADMAAERVLTGPRNRQDILSIIQLRNRYGMSNEHLLRRAFLHRPQSDPESDYLPNLFCAHGTVYFPIDTLAAWESREARGILGETNVSKRAS